MSVPTPPPLLDAEPEREPTSGHGFLLGRVGGVPIYLGKSWFVIAALIVLTFGPDISRALPQLGALTGYGVALAYAILLCLSVFAHEAGHAIVARRCGYHVERIVANLWGGHTAFGSAAPSPGRSALVAVCGPLTNLLLAAIGYGLLSVVEPGIPRLLIYAWTFSNTFVAVFNLLPGLPLDGGFLVDALVWRMTGRRSAGLVAGGWAGRLVTVVALVVLLVLPLTRGQSPSLWNVAWGAFIGAFLWAGASSAIAAGRSMGALERVSIGAVVRTAYAVPADLPVAHLPGPIQAGIDAPGQPVAVVISPHGIPVGLVDAAALARLTPQERAVVPVGALLVAMPPSWAVPAPADPSTSVTVLLSALLESPGRALVLLDPDGRVFGVVSARDVESALG